MSFEHFFLNSTDDFALSVDRELRLRWVNKSMSASLGGSEGALVGQRCHEVWHGRDEPCPGCPAREAQASGAPRRGVVSDREGRRWLISAQPIREGGEIVGAAEIAVDVTETSCAEVRHPESEERYRKLIETCPDGITLIDLAGNVITMNEQAARLYGCESVEEFRGLGRSVYDFIHPDDRVRALENARRALVEGSVHSIEYRLLRGDGSVYSAEISASVLRGPDGSPEGFIGVIRDVSERQRAEWERRQLQAQMLHAQKLESLGVLAGGIAHDFNNFLMGILGNVSLLLQTLPPDRPAREYAERIERTGEHAAELTRQLLAYSGRGEFSVDSVDLSSLVAEMGQLLRLSISKRARLSWELADELPRILVDSSQVRQIVMNLITNASEALGEGEGLISIKTGLVRADQSYLKGFFAEEPLLEGEYVFLEVSDSGCGMDETTKSRIFEPFFSTKFTGRGLGLAAAVGIVRSHNGAIRVYSEPDRGSTFKVLFPALGGGQPTGTSRLGAEGGAPASAEAASGATILVVDDEPVVREVVRSMLESSGFSVLEAGDGVDALALYRERVEQIDAVLLDVTMPQMDGAETYVALRRLHPEVRVILSSGYDQGSATSRLTDDGLSGFIQKPYCLDDLLSVLRTALEPISSGLASPS